MNSAAIPFDAIERHISAAVRYGWSLDALLANSMIELRHGDHRDTVTPAQHALLCMNTNLAAEDATLGMARIRLPANYPAIGATMMLGCATLESGIQALCRLYASASAAVGVQLQTQQDEAILSIHVDPTVELDAVYLEEVFLVWMYIQCLHFLGHAPPIFEVSLRDPFHFSLGRQHWAIRGPVRYGQLTSFRFPRALLGEPPVSRAGACVIWECQERWLDYVSAGPSMATAADFVTDTGFVYFADMVRESGKSANTVRRYLRESQGSFRDARQRALVNAAMSRLCAGDENIETIAAELGYADTSSFRRFFKRATGLTPQQVRHQNVIESSTADLRVLLEIKARCEKMNF